MTNLHPEKVVWIPSDPDPQQTGAPSKVLNWKGDEKKTKKKYEGKKAHVCLQCES